MAKNKEFVKLVLSVAQYYSLDFSRVPVHDMRIMLDGTVEMTHSEVE